MMKMTMKTLCASLVSATALMGFGGQALAQKVTLTVTAPAQTAGNAYKTTTRFTPCRAVPADQALPDFLTFTISATALAAGNDIYLLFRGPDHQTYLSAQKTNPLDPLGGGLELVPHAAVANGTALQAAAPLPYVVKASHLGATFSETIFGGAIPLSGLPTGTWQAIAIVTATDGATPTPAPDGDFSDQRTWAAWDVATFMVGAPWPLTTFAGPPAAVACGSVPAS